MADKASENFVQFFIEEDRAVIRVNGPELDVDTSPDLRAHIYDALEQPGVRSVIVDLEKVSYLDSLGAGVLLRASRIALESNKSFSLRNPSERITHALGILGIDTLFDIEFTELDDRD